LTPSNGSLKNGNFLFEAQKFSFSRINCLLSLKLSKFTPVQRSNRQLIPMNGGILYWPQVPFAPEPWEVTGGRGPVLGLIVAIMIYIP
jgi:hypothetical protein